MQEWSLKRFPTRHAGPAVVDNRVLVLGLNALYRKAMKVYEADTLLPCAQQVAQALNVPPAQVPVEGYYTESRDLETYFRYMRALQDVPDTYTSRVNHLAEFRLLQAVTQSSLYGHSIPNGTLLPTSRDPLGQALKDNIPRWDVATLVPAAHAIALEWNDGSLVGLAARLQDAVALAATRESVVLYAEVMTFGVSGTPRCEWRVDDALAEAANRFIETFNRFVPQASPAACADNAEAFYEAYADDDLVGRCVRLGKTDDGQNYHWAICLNRDLTPRVDTFWSNNLWTTARYRENMSHWPFDVGGVPGESTMTQEELWANAGAIKRQVRNIIGSNLSHEFRSLPAFMAYTGLCGEAQIAHEEGELTEEIVDLMQEYAAKVIELWKNEPVH